MFVEEWTHPDSSFPNPVGVACVSRYEPIGRQSNDEKHATPPGFKREVSDHSCYKHATPPGFKKRLLPFHSAKTFFNQLRNLTWISIVGKIKNVLMRKL